MKVLKSLFLGIVASGMFGFMLMLIGNPFSPQIGLLLIALFFLYGCVIGWIAVCKQERKKEEEEERQAEQDRTNALMRQYLEKKMKEDAEKGL